jgi:hypothetical protein
MHTNSNPAVQYPVGRFDLTAPIEDAELPALIDSVRALPSQLADLLGNGSIDALINPYREGGWTGVQVIHHLADSHMNAFIRFKLALTEDRPTIRPYDQDGWAQTADNAAPVEASLQILHGIHARWATILDAMTPSDFDRAFHHPEQGRDFTLRTTLGMYAWHGRHHLEHVRTCLRGG